MDGAVLDVGLVRQIVRRLDGRLHPLDREKCCQVGRVGRDDDEGESPPEGGETKTFMFLPCSTAPLFPLAYLH